MSGTLVGYALCSTNAQTSCPGRRCTAPSTAARPPRHGDAVPAHQPDKPYPPDFGEHFGNPLVSCTDDHLTRRQDASESRLNPLRKLTSPIMPTDLRARYQTAAMRV